MASITTYLNKILSSVYGKDVRQSIYDSINAINTQVNTYSSAETARVNAEKTRASNEAKRVSAESDREDEFASLQEQVQELMEAMMETMGTQISLKDVYPVGSIYISINSTNPSSLFGGTWVAWGSGRVPVGVNTSDSYFSTVEKTGGSKYVQNHTHVFTGTAVTVTGGAHSHTLPYPVPSSPANDQEGESYDADFGYYEPQSELVESTNSSTHSHTFTAQGTIGGYGSGSYQNLQPYITCYMWKRTA